MIVKTTGTVNPITIELVPAAKLRLSGDIACDLEPETLGYAVCRFLVHNPGLLRRYAAESCALRFAKGRERHPIRRVCVSPAALLELPGGWASLYLTISPETVTVTELCLTAEYPQLRANADLRSPTVEQSKRAIARPNNLHKK